MDNQVGVRIVITGIRKARVFSDSERNRGKKAYVRLAKMDDGTIRAISVYKKRGAEFIFDPKLEYAYPRGIYQDYSRRRIIRETPLGRTINPQIAALRLFGKAKDAIETEETSQEAQRFME